MLGDAGSDARRANPGRGEDDRSLGLDGAGWERLRIDGGMSANDWLAQDLADVLGLEVERPAFVETTALGTFMHVEFGEEVAQVTGKQVVGFYDFCLMKAWMVRRY